MFGVWKDLEGMNKEITRIHSAYRPRHVQIATVRGWNKMEMLGGKKVAIFEILVDVCGIVK